jgi:hypothetical protein
MPRDPDFIQLQVGENADPQHLREVLSAQLDYQRLRNLRRYFVAVLALLGAGLWLLTIWPAAVSKQTRTYGLELWGLCGAATLFAALLEFKSYRRRAKLLRQNPPPDERKPTP